MQILVVLHSLNRFVLLILLLIVIGKSLMGWLNKSSFEKTDDKLSLFLFYRYPHPTVAWPDPLFCKSCRYLQRRRDEGGGHSLLARGAHHRHADCHRVDFAGADII